MFTDSGHGEGIKLATHAALGGLATCCLAYNAIAWWRRGEAHLAVNVVSYSILVVLELVNVRRHAEHL